MAGFAIAQIVDCSQKPRHVIADQSQQLVAVSAQDASDAAPAGRTTRTACMVMVNVPAVAEALVAGPRYSTCCAATLLLNPPLDITASKAVPTKAHIVLDALRAPRLQSIRRLSGRAELVEVAPQQAVSAFLPSVPAF
jgi:hypothetical protein